MQANGIRKIQQLNGDFMLMSKSAIVKWGTRNKKYYTDIGYNFTKFGDEFEVNIEDLQHGSNVIISIKCDYCGKIKNVAYSDYVKSHSDIGGDACKTCGIKKREKIMLEEKGVRCAFELEDVKEKSKHTMLKRYGVEHSMQSDIVKEKSKQTCLDKYGCEYIMQSEDIVAKRNDTWNKKYNGHPMSTKEVQDKRIKTTLDKYGVEWITQADFFKELCSSKCMDKYGVDNFGKVEELHKKGLNTMRKNGTLPVSKPEMQLIELLENIYGKNACTPSKIIGYYTLDCELIVNDVKIDVEYDGIYWHYGTKKQIGKDNARNKYIQNHGYKVLRIVSNNSIPKKSQIIDIVNKLVTTDETIAYIVLS